MSKTAYGNDNTPFFILGCVRSGTTMLRDLLRLHPRLECPEETHFYRWADPYGSPRYDRNYIAMKIFERHRKMDGISNHDFHDARQVANHRRDLSDAYGRLYLQAKNKLGARWFDKTPQNVYGLFLIAYQYPQAKFVHIHRHPLNVVASLVEGRVMAKHSVKGAINYWMEAMILLDQFKKTDAERLIEIPYEEITTKPETQLTRLCEFLSEDAAQLDMHAIRVHPEQHNYARILSKDEIRYVMDQVQPFAAAYGYGELTE